MVNQSVIDSSVDLEQLKDIEDLIPDMDKAISEKVETFLDKSGDQPYAHMNEGYVVVVEMTGEIDTTFSEIALSISGIKSSMSFNCSRSTLESITD